MATLLTLASILALAPLLAILLPLAMVLALEWDRAINGERWEATLVEDPPNVLAGLWGQPTVAALRAIGRHEGRLQPIEIKYLKVLIDQGQSSVALATVGGYLSRR